MPEPAALVAFTTASAERPLYRRDALNAIAYPDGWQLDLTYRGRWIDDALKQPLAEGALKGRTLLVVLCGAPNEQTQTYDRAIPLRFGRVLRSWVEGDLADGGLSFLQVQLGPRPSGNLLEGFAAAASGLPRRPALSGPQARYLVQADPLADADPEISWDSHVDALQQLPELADCHFFCWKRLTEKTASLAEGPSPKVSLAGRTDATLIELVAGRLYEIQLYQHRSFLASGSSVDLAVRGEHVDIAEPVVKQHGSGALVSHLSAGS